MDHYGRKYRDRFYINMNIKRSLCFCPEWYIPGNNLGVLFFCWYEGNLEARREETGAEKARGGEIGSFHYLVPHQRRKASMGFGTYYGSIEHRCLNFCYRSAQDLTS